MKTPSKTIKYSREELNNIIRELKGNVDLVFDVKELSENEQKLIGRHYKISNLNYLAFKDEFIEIIGKFKSKIIYKYRLVVAPKDAFNLVNEIIDKLKLYDFWIISAEKIICLNHEQEICIINKRYL